MQRRILAVVALVLTMMVPATALAGHITYYRYVAVEHDDQGTILEPDGLGTGILGPEVAGCNVELPGALGGFASRCNLDAGSGKVIAPGCTGDGPDGPVRRLSGQCGLWTIGVGTPDAPNVVPPQSIPAPVTEAGMAGDAAPGLAGSKSVAIRFLDTQIFSAVQPQGIGVVTNTHQIDMEAKFREIARVTGIGVPGQGSQPPGDAIVHVWFGEWRDLNGNGVLDHFTPGTAGASQNEFTWLGNCQGFTGQREPTAVTSGICKEDPNPNAVPPGRPCADPDSPVACAGASVLTWIWPGNHGANGFASDFPGSAVGGFVLGLGDCDAACQDEYDPILGPQGDVAPEIRGIIDATGDLDDVVRRWYSGTGGTTSFYDNGMLLTMLTVTGINCAETSTPVGADLATCSFRDVDRYPSFDPAFDNLLVGSGDSYPNGGLKGALRGAWVLARDMLSP
jgi:hypothetical protein